MSFMQVLWNPQRARPIRTWPVFLLSKDKQIFWDIESKRKYLRSSTQIRTNIYLFFH